MNENNLKSSFYKVNSHWNSSLTFIRYHQKLSIMQSNEMKNFIKIVVFSCLFHYCDVINISYYYSSPNNNRHKFWVFRIFEQLCKWKKYYWKVFKFPLNSLPSSFLNAVTAESSLTLTNIAVRARYFGELSALCSDFSVARFDTHSSYSWGDSGGVFRPFLLT